MKTKLNKEIIRAEICPYCGNKPQYIDSSIIYSKSYGMIYFCSPCNASVGVHKYDNITPLGRLANKELKEYKIKAHYYFDKLWKKPGSQGRNKHEARKAAYAWLSDELNIHKDHTHIGMFDIPLCKKVIKICKKYI